MTGAYIFVYVLSFLYVYLRIDTVI